MPRQAVNNLVKNGNFEYAPSFTAAQTTSAAYIDGTATGSTTNGVYGWGALITPNANVKFDTSVSSSGAVSLAINTTDASGLATLSLAKDGATPTKAEVIPVLPSTSYTLTCRIKTTNSPTNGSYFDLREYGGALSIVLTTSSTKLTGTNDWTTISVTVTTNSSTRFIMPLLRRIAGSVGTTWFDDIRLDLTSNTTRSVASNRIAIQDMKSSLYFNGAASVSTSSNSTLSLANGFTVAGWIKVSKYTTASNRQRIIGTTNWAFGVKTAGNKLSFTTVAVTDYDSTGASIQPGTWVFAGATLDSSNDVTFYLNGILDSVVTGTNPATTTASVTSLGQRPTPTDLHIGNLSGVRVFNRELTAQEILSLYNGIVPSGVIAEYNLNEGAGSIAYDSSGNGNNGTITSGTYVLDTPSKKRKAVNGNLVYNGDFEYAPVVNAGQTGGDTWINGTVAGSSSNIFGWYVYSYNGTRTAEFDTSVYYSGTKSLKLSLGATSSNIGIASNKTSGNPKIEADGYIPLLPNTSYTASVRVKTNITSGSATTGVAASFVEKIGVGTGSTITVLVTGLITTQDWTQYTATFTTGATTRYGAFELRLTGNNGAATLIGDAWFDDIQLVPTTAVARTVAT